MTTAHEVFNPVTNTWSTAAPMINQRKAFGTTSLNNLFYAIGGIDTITGSNGSVLNERYNPVANNWTTLASMPTGRYGCSAAAANGRVYVFGGQIGPVGSGNTNANEEYNPGTNTWQARAPMPESLRYTGAVNFNNLIYVYGGSRNSGIKNEFVYVYNPTSNTWYQAAGTMPTPRSTLMPDSMRNFMMTVGGGLT
jgi:N-acetylneuraminic acid mutarotase